MAAEDDKQATFTGADQRAGVFVLAYAVAGIFGRGRPKPAKATDNAAGTDVAGVRKGSSKGSRARKGVKKASAKISGGGGKGPAVFGANDKDDDEELPTGFKFDWDSYRAAFGETPIEDAVTIMFAEYAELYARIAGWTTSAAPAAMSLDEGAAIQQQASNFVINIMSPILGYVHTSKVHKLLAHTMDSIRFHGHLRHGNTSTNEAAHKMDKQFYRRTNMAIETFTGQLVRQAQGSREVGRRNDAADAIARQTLPVVPPCRPRRAARVRTGASDMAAAADGELQASAVAPAVDREAAAAANDAGAPGAAAAAEAAGAPGAAARLGGHAGAAPAADAAGKPRSRRSATYLTRRTIGTLAQRPGLADIGTLFELPPQRNVPVLSTVEFPAQFNCGTKSNQLLRASPNFRDERPWYDAILFSVESSVDLPDAGLRAAAGGGLEDISREELYVGEVRAIIRCKEDDYAVVCQMKAVDAVRGCPFSRRDCERLKWAVSSNGGHVIRAVPLKRVRRLLHLVPDFKDLATRKGLGAAPAGYRAPLADQLAMHYFVNEFYPWA